MSHLKFGALAVAVTFALTPTLTLAQAAESERLVAIYRAAPGHQVQLLQWLARQDEAARAAGVQPCQLYAHRSGASWDYINICPVTTAAQDKAADSAGAKMGMAVGPKASMEFREHIAEHSDTLAAGPTTAAALLKALGSN